MLIVIIIIIIIISLLCFVVIIFRAACFIHDLCYATPGRTQQQCDFEFKMNMLTTCRIPGIGSLAYPVCANAAEIAFIAVSASGNTFPDFAATCTEV